MSLPKIQQFLEKKNELQRTQIHLNISIHSGYKLTVQFTLCCCVFSFAGSWFLFLLLDLLCSFFIGLPFSQPKRISFVWYSFFLSFVFGLFAILTYRILIQNRYVLLFHLLCFSSESQWDNLESATPSWYRRVNVFHIS